MKQERRYHIGDKFRAAVEEAEDGLHLSGMGIVYNVWSEDLGGFIEMNQINAAQEVIATDDIRGLFNHSSSKPLARVNGPMKPTMVLTNSDAGVHYNMLLGDNSVARDVHDWVGRGDVTGSSYQFRLGNSYDEEKANEAVVWDEDIQLYRRTVLHIPMMFDIGPVTFPAYPDSSSQARSLVEVWEKRMGIGAAASADEKAEAILNHQIQIETEIAERNKRRMKSCLL